VPRYHLSERGTVPGRIRRVVADALVDVVRVPILVQQALQLDLAQCRRVVRVRVRVHRSVRIRTVAVVGRRDGGSAV
jgi:hypothetical protein